MKKTLNNFQKMLQLLLVLLPTFVFAQNCGNLKLTSTVSTCINNGTISIDTTSGIGLLEPYQFSASGPTSVGFSTDTIFTSLLPGLYTVTLKDANNYICTATIAVGASYIKVSNIVLTPNNCQMKVSWIGTGKVFKVKLFNVDPLNNPSAQPFKQDTTSANSYVFKNLSAGTVWAVVVDKCGNSSNSSNGLISIGTLTASAQMIGTDSVKVNLSGAAPSIFTYKLYIGNMLKDSIISTSPSIIFANANPACGNTNYITVKDTLCKTGQVSYNLPNITPQIIVDCVNWDNGTATVRGQNGKTPYIFECLKNGVDVVASSNTGIFTGIPTSATTLNFRIKDACGTYQYSPYFTRPTVSVSNSSADCLTGKSSFSGSFATSSGMLFTPISVSCPSCSPAAIVTITGNNFTISNLPIGNFIVEAKDYCGNTTFIKDSSIVDISFEGGQPCKQLKAYLNTATYFIKYVNGIAINSSSILNVGTKTYYLYNSAGTPIDTNTTGVFINKPYGNYTVKLVTGCGLEIQKLYNLQAPNSGQSPNPTISYTCIGGGFMGSISSTGLVPNPSPTLIDTTTKQPFAFNTLIPLGVYQVDDCNGTKIINLSSGIPGSGNGAPAIDSLKYTIGNECDPITGNFKFTVTVIGTKTGNYNVSGPFTLTNVSTGVSNTSINNQFTGLLAGDYLLSAAGACVFPTPVKLVDPPKSHISSWVSVPFCLNGKFVVNISASSPYGGPYTLTDSTTNNIIRINQFNNILAGTYYITAPCAEPKKVVIKDPIPTSINSKQSTPYCLNGKFVVSVHSIWSTYGGLYTLTDSTTNTPLIPTTTNQFDNVPAGTYFLTSPCDKPTRLVVKDPLPELIPYTISMSCVANKFVYKIATNTQFAPFTLTNTSGTAIGNGNSFDGLDPGTYYLESTCALKTTVNLAPFPIMPKIKSTYLKVCDIINLDVSCNDPGKVWATWKDSVQQVLGYTVSLPSTYTSCGGSIVFKLTNGSNAYTGNNFNCIGSTISANFNNIQPGTYFLSLEMPCVTTDKKPIIVPQYKAPDATVSRGIICDDKTTANVVFKVSSYSPPFIYEQINCVTKDTIKRLKITSDSSIIVKDLPAGTYCFRVLDACGHTDTYDTQVGKLGEITANFNVKCDSIKLSIDKISGCEYTWFDDSKGGTGVQIGMGEIIMVAADSISKKYRVFVNAFDAGCRIERRITIEPYKGVVPKIKINNKGKNSACFGETVKLEAQIINGVPATFIGSIKWKDASGSVVGTGYSFSAAKSGWYKVFAYNKFKPSQSTSFCSNSDSILIVIPTEKLALEVTKKDIRCYQTKDGTIDVKSTGGILPYRYSWNDSIKTQNRANLPPALYSVTLTDSIGCTDIKAVNIEEPRPFGILRKENQASNCDPFVKVIIQGGTPPYQVKIDNVLSQNTSDSTDLCLKEGSYTITITDNNKCDTSFNYSFKKIDLPTRENPVKICYGTVYKIGKHIYDKDGVYYDTLQSNVNVKCNLCDTIWKTTLDVLDPVIASVSADDSNDLICDGASTQLRTSASGGLGMPYTYAWSSKQNTKDITVKYRGNYMVTVTDGLGCSAVANRVIKVDSFIIQFDTGQRKCGHDPMPWVSASGGGNNGVLPYTYIWPAGTNFNNDIAYNLNPGVYTVTATDSEGCTSIADYEVIKLDTLKVLLSAEKLEICRGTTTTLFIEGKGGNEEFPITNKPYYNITGVNQANQPIKITPIVDSMSLYKFKATVGIGTYTVNILDSKKCSSSNTITIKPAEIGSKIIQKDSLCEGSTIILEAGSTKAKKAKSYQWYKMPTWEHIVGNDNKPLIVSIKSSYALVQENDLECKDTAFWTVNVVAIPQIKLVGDYILCKSGDKGKMSVTHLNNVTHKYNYTWNPNNKDTSNIEIFSPRAYIVTVIDAVTRCKTIDTAIVKDISNWIPEIKQLVPFCEGKSATLSANIGNAQAIWYKDGVHLTAFDDKSQIQVNQAGKYRVKVTKGSCIGESIDFEVKLYANPILNIVKDTMVCTKKMLTLKPTSPTAVNYLWSNGAMTKNVEVPKGSYSLTVTDAIGCKAVQTINVNEHPDFIPTVEAHKQICPNDSIKIKLNGVYTTYLWSDASTLTTLIASKSGSYSVTVTNKEGCTAIATTVITDANVIKPLLESVKICPSTQGEIKITNANEFTYIKWIDGSTKSSIYFDKVTTLSVEVKDKNECPSTRTITTEVHLKPQIQLQLPTVCESKSGIITTKTPFVNYLWNDGSTMASLSVNATGNYSVTVTDQNGCKADTTTGFSLKPNPKPKISGPKGVCAGADIKLSTINTTGIATYQWTNGLNTPEVTYKQVGTYFLTVTDRNGCTGTDSIGVEISDGLKVDIPPTKSCLGDTVKIDLGNTFDTYLWSNGKTTQSIEVTEAGDYSVTVTAKNCSGIGKITVSFFDNPIAKITGKDLICKGNTTVLTTNYPTNIWSSGAINSDSITVKSGVHSVTVTDANGCKGVSTMEIKERPEVKPEVTNGASCLGTLIPLSLKDANLYSSFQWSTGEKTASINVDKADIYRITVIDTNGCIGETTASASFNPLPSVKIKGAKTTLCPLEQVDIVADTEAGNQIKWSNNLTTANIKIGQGTYFVTVTNSHGCTAMDTLTLKDVPQIEAAMNIVGTKVCHGDSVFLNIKFKNLDGKSANATIKSGNDFITYNNLIKDTVIVLKPTISSIYNFQNIIINNYSCPIIFDKNQQFEVKASQLDGSITAANQSCFGITDGKVVLKTNADSFKWSNPIYTEKELKNLTKGIFSVTLTDALNCTLTKSVTLTEPEALLMVAKAMQTCNSKSEGEIEVTSSGGVAPFTYILNGKKHSESLIKNLSAGQYKVVTIDTKGCKSKEQTLSVGTYPILTLDLSIDRDSAFIVKGDTAQIKAIIKIDKRLIRDVNEEDFREFVWLPYQCSDCLEIPTQSDSSGTYRLRITDKYGCKANGNIFVELRQVIHKVDAPNAVDNDNRFKLLFPHKSVRKVNVLRIFDRWGNLVYEELNFKPNEQIGWDGTFRGQKVDPAVYAWFAVVQFLDGAEITVKGDVSTMLKD